MATRIIYCIFVLGCMSGCVPGGGGHSSSCTPGDTGNCTCPDGTFVELPCGKDERSCVCADDGGTGDGGVGVGRARDGGAGDGNEGDGAVGPADHGLGGDSGPCIPNCERRVCGDDGCGGACGACGADDVCVAGQCGPAPDTCGNGVCDDAETCSTCAEDCACSEGQNCVLGTCEALAGGAPRFLTLNSNVPRMTEGEQVTFSAVVTDPDGIDDLIGGVLEDPNGRSYGAFISSGQEGAYAMTINWGEIHRISPIEFERARDRTFVASFFDQGGARSRMEIRLELHCDGIAACDGTCLDLSDDAENCGACRTACHEDATCGDGVCVCNRGFFGCGNGVCVPERTVCDRTDDCGDGSDEAGCCFADGDCPLGQMCEGDNRCADGCADNDRCPAAEQCRDGACVPGCRRDEDCLGDEYCGADNRCAVGCRDDSSCPDGRICEARSCVVGCRGDDACGAGRICEDQICLGGCRADAACGVGRICEDQSCRAGCRQDPGCGPGEICQGSSCIEGCRDDAGCALDRVCRAARCVAGCQVDDVCPVGELCIRAQCQVGCNDARPCPGDGVCIEGGCQPGCLVDSSCRPDEYCDRVCRLHLCGDGRLGPDEECDAPGQAGCVDCRIDGDVPRHVEGDEPYLIEFDGAGRFELMFRNDGWEDVDTFTVRSGAGVIRAETLSWTRVGCASDTLLTFENSEGGTARDDDGGDGLCSLLTAEDDPDMAVSAGDHTLSVRDVGGRRSGFNLLIVEFLPADAGEVCDPDGPEVCPAGSYCSDASVCLAHVCGDGVLDPGEEECDDGNNADGDGCEGCERALLSEGRACFSFPEIDVPVCDVGLMCHPVEMICVVAACGDGFVGGDEQCEDDNDVPGDGCEDCRFDPFNGEVEPDDFDAPWVLDLAGGEDAILFQLEDGQGAFTDDLDIFRIDLETTRHLRVRLVDYPSGACASDARVGLFDADGTALTAPLDPRIESCVALDTTEWPNPAIGVLPPGTYYLQAEPVLRGSSDGIWLHVEAVPPAACEDRLDNDEDGRVDAADPGCVHRLDGDELDPAEPAQCSDGEDNDGDALVDWPEDPDCLFAGGGSEACGGFDNLIEVPPEGGVFQVSTEGRPDRLRASCAGIAQGGEAPLRVVLAAEAVVTVRTLAADFDDALYLRDSCRPDGEELACDDPWAVDQGAQLDLRLPAGVYYYFVDGLTGGTANVSVTIRPTEPAPPQ